MNVGNNKEGTIFNEISKPVFVTGPGEVNVDLMSLKELSTKTM